MGKTQTKSPFSNGSLWKRGLMHTCGSSSTILDRVAMDQFRFSRLPSFSRWDLVWSLICSLRIQSTDTDLGGAKSSVWNFCTRFSDVISRGNQCRMTSRKCRLFSQAIWSEKANFMNIIRTKSFPELNLFANRRNAYVKKELCARFWHIRWITMFPQPGRGYTRPGLER